MPVSPGRVHTTRNCARRASCFTSRISPACSLECTSSSTAPLALTLVALTNSANGRAFRSTPQICTDNSRSSNRRSFRRSMLWPSGILRDHSEEPTAAKHHAGYRVPVTADTGKIPQNALLERYLSVLKISATTFHCLSCFLHTTTYLPTSVLTLPWASLVFNSNVPMS